MNETNYVASATTTTSLSQKVVPLLQALNRAEELASSLAMRLDPIVNHVQAQDKPPVGPTVTSRIHAVGDVLQYLLDNIEL
jgi:hypothetical protein